jgi:multiple sugar transport system substrate-binding protein
VSARLKITFTICLLAGCLGAVSACGSSAPAGSGVSSGSGGGAKGSSITVAVAYPSPPAAELAKFTKQTGVNVKWVNVGWDDLQTKIVAASTAHTYFADVTDVDWSKVGEYQKLGWFYPLQQYFPVSSLSAQVPQLHTFISNNQLMGMPMDSSFMVTTMNNKDLHKAGVTTMPTTLSQYTADLQKMKSAGVAHPLNIPFQAQEGLSTYWYETTNAFGGHILTAAGKPAFTSPSSPGYKALAWMVSAYKQGLVPPGNLNIADVSSLETNMAHNQTASSLSEYSGDVGTIYNVPNSSSVVNQVSYIPTPSVTGTGPNLSNPDGIGIPKTTKNFKGALEFIRWFDSPAQQALWAGGGGGKGAIVSFPLPMRNDSMAILAKDTHGKDGITQLSKLLTGSQPVFQNGAPSWYSQFSNAVYTNIHSAAAGQESVASAISAIAQAVQSK